MEIKLTEKQRIFCHEYVVDYNGSRAARVAGYSEKAAKETAYILLTKSHINTYIEHIQKDLCKLSGVTAMRNIKELEKIAYSTIAHLHNTWIERKEFEQLTDDQKASIQSISTKVLKKNIGDKDSPEIVDVEYVEIKLYDKIKAMDMLNKMLGLNKPDKVDVTTAGESLNLSDEDRIKRIKALVEAAKKIEL